MPTGSLGQFHNAASELDIYAYNEMLLDGMLEGQGQIFTGKLILDAGAGRRVNHFRRQIATARSVVGIDRDYDDLRGNRDVDARVVGDIQCLPFQSGAFDCVFTVDVVEHLDDPAAFFRGAARCLKPGGRLIVCTPNLLGYKNLAAYVLPRPAMDFMWRRFKGRSGQPHPTYYRSNTPRSLRRLSAAAGLAVEQVRYLDEIPHFFHGHQKLSMLAYFYGRLIQRLRLGVLLNYTVSIFSKASYVGLARAEDDAAAGHWQDGVVV